MNTILAISFSCLLLILAANAQQRHQPSDSPPVTITVTQPAGPSVFFAANGNDNNPCSQTAPCQTLAKASLFTYQPGATINFRGGDTFLGEFHLARLQVPSGGDPNNPIIIQSYGGGRATIASNQDGVNGVNLGPKNWAMLIDCTSGVTVQDLNVSANGHYVQYGIIVQNTCGTRVPQQDYAQQQAAGMIHNIIVQRVDVSGFTLHGPAPYDNGAQIMIAGFAEVVNRGTCGPIETVQILDSKVHGDTISSESFDGISTKHCNNLWNITFRGNEAYYLGGIAGVGGGNGLFMQGVTNGLMEHNHAHHLMYNLTQVECGGPYAIWAYDPHTSNITIQFNEVDHVGPSTWPNGSCDFGAYDFDDGVTNSTIQYNYSHDNAGPAVLNYGSASNNTIRYNISVNDGFRGGNRGTAIDLNPNGTPSGPNYIYNNTVIGPYARASFSAYSYGPGTLFKNNIFINTALDPAGNWMGSSPLPGSAGNLTVSNNIYFTTVPNPPAIKFCIGGGCSDFATWQGAGWETNSLVANPQLTNNSGTPADITWDPTQHTGPQPQPSYQQLLPGSPALGAGVSIPNNGGRDYYGNAVPATGAVNIGAFQ